jgi:hypothetical protein
MKDTALIVVVGLLIVVALCLMFAPDRPRRRYSPMVDEIFETRRAIGKLHRAVDRETLSFHLQLAQGYHEAVRPQHDWRLPTPFELAEQDKRQSKYFVVDEVRLALPATRESDECNCGKCIRILNAAGQTAVWLPGHGEELASDHNGA